MSTPNEWPATVSNYYGCPTLKRRGDGWVLALGNYDEESTAEVTEAFAQAWRDQFPVIKKTRTCWDCNGVGRWPEGPWGPAVACMTCDGEGKTADD